MKIRVHCDCGKRLVASDQLAGKSAKCPACGALIRLPRLEEVSEQPASFLVTETGLNLTTDPQEIGAAPGEEMPPQFSVSSADQTPVTSPEPESSHGVADSSKTTNNEDPVDLRHVRKPNVQRVSTMWKLGRIVGRIPVLRFALESALEVERRTGIRIVAGIGLVAWLLTLGSPPSEWVMVHYLGLATVVVGTTLEIAGRVPRLKPHVLGISIFAVVGSCWLWTHFDCYEERRVSEDGTTIANSRTFSGRLYHRRVRWKDDEQSDGSYISGASLEGPMAGDPPKPHGHWTYTRWETTHMWFWYGDKITQGEWELRNK